MKLLKTLGALGVLCTALAACSDKKTTGPSSGSTADTLQNAAQSQGIPTEVLWTTAYALNRNWTGDSSPGLESARRGTFGFQNPSQGENLSLSEESARLAEAIQAKRQNTSSPTPKDWLGWAAAAASSAPSTPLSGQELQLSSWALYLDMVDIWNKGFSLRLPEGGTWKQSPAANPISPSSGSLFDSDVHRLTPFEGNPDAEDGDLDLKNLPTLELKWCQGFVASCLEHGKLSVTNAFHVLVTPGVKEGSYDSWLFHSLPKVLKGKDGLGKTGTITVALALGQRPFLSWNEMMGVARTLQDISEQVVKLKRPSNELKWDKLRPDSTFWKDFLKPTWDNEKPDGKSAFGTGSMSLPWSFDWDLLQKFLVKDLSIPLPRLMPRLSFPRLNVGSKDHWTFPIQEAWARVVVSVDSSAKLGEPWLKIQEDDLGSTTLKEWDRNLLFDSATGSFGKGTRALRFEIYNRSNELVSGDVFHLIAD